ncbi:MAG: toxin-antitoxin system HicB family antitoxin, partial [Clostridia bacterium]|nr:toxin-antitoxin system HicB family antitoxin [Clostridia bacterium]
INKTFRLPAELVERLERIAQNNGISLNNLVVQCCEYALNDMSVPDECTERKVSESV